MRWGKVCEDSCKIENSNSSDMSFKNIHGPFISWMTFLFCFVFACAIFISCPERQLILQLPWPLKTGTTMSVARIALHLARVLSGCGSLSSIQLGNELHFSEVY